MMNGGRPVQEQNYVKVAFDDGNRYLPAMAVCARWSITDMTLYRWLRDPAKNLPRPYYFGRLRYFKLSEIEAWERSVPRSRAG
jgi:predicted DNA-binding transcriptional regulator AlpA